MKIPKISVIMPVYNGEKYLREAIDSILNQTFTDFEFLICNEFGSDDDSADIINEYAEKDLRVIPIQNDTQLGISASLNRMLDIAKGEFIARMDADDISGRRRFEIQLLYMDKYPNIGCFGINHAVIGSNYWRVQYHSDPNIVRAQTVLFAPMRHPSVMWRAIADARYDENLLGAEDMRFYQDMAKRKVMLSNIQDKSLFRYRVTDGMTSKVMSGRDHSIDRDNIKKYIYEMLSIELDEHDAGLLCFQLGSTQYDGDKESAGFDRLHELLASVIKANNNIGAFERYAIDYLAYHRWHKEMELMANKYGGKANVPQYLLDLYETCPFYRMNTSKCI